MNNENFEKMLSEYEPGAITLIEKGDFSVDFTKPKQFRKESCTKRTTAIRRKNDIKHKKRRIRIVKTGNSYYPYKGYVVQRCKNGALKELNHVKYPNTDSKTQQFWKKETHRRNRRRPIDTDMVYQKGNRYRKESVDYCYELF